MERVIVASIRGTFCALMLASLAACGDGSESDTSTPAVQQPITPVGQQPSTPPPSSSPVEPSEPTPPTDSSNVDNSNSAPQISGSPATEVPVGQGFSFVPSVTDADADDLSFSVSSKPNWASFDSKTGRLWGTPGQDDVGTHEEIVIRVTDGDATRSLPEFSINVVQIGGNVTLAWQPPTENTDGSSLDNLKGYKLHYGIASGDYDTTITIENAGTTRYVIENLEPGTYFFAISAVNEKGVESEMSGEANKTI